jgi:hypothetical protein
MEIIDCTPPSNLPAQLIMLDKDLSRRHPEKEFFLRVANGQNVGHIDLDGAVTTLDARRIARAKGFDPKHWAEAHTGRVTPFYYANK